MKPAVSIKEIILRGLQSNLIIMSEDLSIITYVNQNISSSGFLRTGVKIQLSGRTGKAACKGYCRFRCKRSGYDCI